MPSLADLGGHAPKMPRPMVAILLCVPRFSMPSVSRPYLAPSHSLDPLMHVIVGTH